MILINSSVYASDTEIEEFYLDNGMQVVVVSNHKAPIVKHIVLYKVGSIDEPLGKGGLAHLLEHLMFRGTHKFRDGEFNRLIEENGGDSNAGTSYDFTYYHQFLNIKSLELAMYLEADRMTGLNLKDESFEREREIVFQERQQRLSSNASNQFWEQYNNILWDNKLYGRPISGTEEEIKNITQQDVLDFYYKFYSPNNAVLILAGDIDVATARKLADKYYGNIKSRPLGDRVDLTPTPSHKSNLNFTSYNPDIQVSRILATYKLPNYKPTEKEQYALLLLAEYLGNNASSPLYNDIIYNKKLAVSMDVNFSFLNRGNSTFSFYAYADTPNQISKIKQEFLSALKKASKQISINDIKQAKERIIAQIIYSKDNPSDMATHILNWLSANYSINDIQKIEENINSVTLEQVRQVASMLTKQHPLWGELHPLKDNK